MNADEARKVSKFLLHGWPGEFSDEALMIYLDALMPLPFEPIAVAIKGMLLTCKFRPSVAEIYEGAMLQVGSAPSTDAALLQGRVYAEYLSQLQWSNGSGYVPDRPQAHPAVVRCCEAMRGAEGFNEITFRKIYAEVAKRYNDAVLRRLNEGTAIESATSKELEG